MKTKKRLLKQGEKSTRQTDISVIFGYYIQYSKYGKQKNNSCCDNCFFLSEKTMRNPQDHLQQLMVLQESRDIKFSPSVQEFFGITNVELFPLIAPLAVRNFDSLVSKQFYDSTAFHRVIPNFMIQGGDPNSRHGPKSTWGYGDPSQPTVNAEFSILSHQRGILSAARDANINSANSQFFICVAADTWLDGQYSIYGHVTSGMNIVDTIVNSPRDANDYPLQKIEMFVTYIGSNDTIPNTPVLLTPANGTQNVPSAKIVTWSAVSGAIMYHLDVSVDSLFSTFFFK